MSILVPLYFGWLIVVGLVVFALLPLGTSMRRGLAAVAFTVSAGMLFVGSTELLSRPKPLRAEILRQATEEAEIIKAYMVEGEAIYLWLLLPGETGPRAYKMPWSADRAKELQKLIEQNGRMMMLLPFQRSWEQRDRIFHPVPQPKYPDKMGTENPEAPTKQFEM